ncbi:MAG: glycosyl hydrolase family 65 protein, partial [Acholeplasmataceae bacterium]
LHLTSIAAAWVNIVYGFGGLRSDGKILRLSPFCPNQWESYQFRIQYFDVNIEVYVDQKEVKLTLDKQLSKPIMIFDKVYELKKGTMSIAMGN